MVSSASSQLLESEEQEEVFPLGEFQFPSSTSYKIGTRKQFQFLHYQKKKTKQNGVGSNTFYAPKIIAAERLQDEKELEEEFKDQ